MNIGIIGLGVVGKAVKFGFEKKQGHEIFVYDIKLKDTSLLTVFKKSDLIFICVSTPEAPDGSCDISNVLDVCGKLDKLAKKSRKRKDIVIKSTIDPRFVGKIGKNYKYLNIAINPEFLKEQAAIHDFCHQDICVIGTENKTLYEKIVKAHGNLAKQYIQTSSINAILIKYFLNTFNATRIIFANLFFDIAESLGGDYSEIKSIAVKRENMIDYYLDCNKNLRGFGGACLPKDTDAIVALCKSLHLEYNMLKAVSTDNNSLNKEYPESM